jgi:hypothetical protein
MKLDELQRAAVNLEIMARITKHDNLSVNSDGLLEIDERYFKGIRRWYEGTTSDNTISCIHSQIVWILQTLSEPKTSDNSIMLRLHSASLGLREHLEHYSDVCTRARIQLIIDMINSIISKKHSKNIM